MFIDILIANNRLKQKAGISNTQAIDQAIIKLTLRQYLRYIQKIQETAFTNIVQTSTNKDSIINNLAFTNSYRLLQEIENVLIIYIATRKIDVGYLYYIIDILIPIFLGSSQNNYSREIIYTRYLLIDTIANKVLQKSILASIVVNPSSIPRKSIAIDKIQEGYNYVYTKDIRDKANSIYDVTTTIVNKALNIVPSYIAQNIIQGSLSIDETIYYTKKSTITKIILYAIKL